MSVQGVCVCVCGCMVTVCVTVWVWVCPCDCGRGESMYSLPHYPDSLCSEQTAVVW